MTEAGNTSNPASSAHDRREFTSLVDTMINLGPLAQLVSTVTGLMLVITMFPYAGAETLFAWYGLLVVTALWRAWVIIRRRRLPQSAPIPYRLFREYQVGVLASGAVWGSSVFLAWPEFETEPLALIVMFLAGMAAGGVVVLSALPRTFSFYALPALLPIIFVLFLQGERYSLIAAVIFFLLIMHKVAGDLHQVLKGNVRLSLRLERERDLASTTVQALAEGVIRVLPDGRIRNINDAAAEMLGIAKLDPDSRLHFNQVFGVQALDGESVWEKIHASVGVERRALDITEDLWYPGPGGAHPGDEGLGHEGPGGDGVERTGDEGRWLKLVARPLLDVDRSLVEIIVVIRDKTSERILIDRLKHHAVHDPLTGSANRRALDSALKRTVEATRTGKAADSALIFADLDGFKQVNDSAGHAFGDRMLEAVARAMRKSLRSEDLVVRVGGDEFAVLLRDTDLAAARKVAEKLAGNVADCRVEHGARSYSVGLSYGLALIDGSQPPDKVISLADMACYAAKHDRKTMDRSDD